MRLLTDSMTSGYALDELSCWRLGEVSVVSPAQILVTIVCFMSIICTAYARAVFARERKVWLGWRGLQGAAARPVKSGSLSCS